jgi:hypothetical protein
LQRQALQCEASPGDWELAPPAAKQGKIRKISAEAKKN